MKQYKIIGIIVMCLLIGGGAGYTFSHSQQKISRLDEMNQLIDMYYLEVDEENTGSIKDKMAKGLVYGIGDPYADFFTAEEYEEYAKKLDADYVGIGGTINSTGLGVVIIDVDDNAPAKKAGLDKGDIILEVDGESTLGKTTSEVVENIVGEEGTSVEIVYLKNGLKYTTTIIRERIGKTINYEILENNVGYLKINSFGMSTASQVEEALIDFKTNLVEDIIIDLRDNGGGELDAAIDILDMFIPENQTVVSVKEKTKTEEYKTTTREKYEYRQGFILVNENTASASEIVCIDLVEQLNYTVIGTNTYGKGIVQSLMLLKEGSAIKFTTGEWLSSKGQSIHNVGIAPNIEVVEEALQAMYEYEDTYEFTPSNLGDINQNIGYLQTMLLQLGYEADDQLNYFGNRTQEALMKFEQDKGLVVNGTYELEDYQVLLSCFSYETTQIAPDLMLDEVFKLLSLN